MNRFIAMLFVCLLVACSAMSTPNLTPLTTEANADQAMNDFVASFWDPQKKYFYTNSDQQIHTHAYGPEAGLYTDFWWEAQLWQVVMDAYERTDDPQYLEMIDDVYDGFRAYYPDFSNNFNDDQGWWALGAIRAYELTGQQRYLDRSVSLFNTLWGEHDTTYGGGIWWRKSPHDQKNVATNAPAAIVSAKLFIATGDSSYLQKSQSLFAWVDNNLQSAGHVYDHIEGSNKLVKWDFTYNFGTYIGAATALYDATGDNTYINKAVAAADWAVANLTTGGTLLYEGENDGGGFKMIFARHLNTLVTEYNQTQYLAFLQRNANQVWSHRRSSDGLMGPNWSVTPQSGYLQSLTAAAGVAVLQFVAADGSTGIQPENGYYEAENAILSGINTESSNAGYSGRGYTAGWNQSSQFITFYVNAPSSGSYELVFNYAAGGGTPSRTLTVNGAVYATAIDFPSTGSWSSWNTKALTNVPLSAGTNTLKLSVGPNNGDYLNLDRITLSLQRQTEDGTLHTLTTESNHSGYRGTGYLAGWNADGQWVDINVNVSRAGFYDVTLRYSAAAGNASRYVYANGQSVADNLTFAGTGNWDTWRDIALDEVWLSAGNNTFSVIYDGAKGSQNYLNLDEITLRYVE